MVNTVLPYYTIPHLAISLFLSHMRGRANASDARVASTSKRQLSPPASLTDEAIEDRMADVRARLSKLSLIVGMDDDLQHVGEDEEAPAVEKAGTYRNRPLHERLNHSTSSSSRVKDRVALQEHSINLYRNRLPSTAVVGHEEVGKEYRKVTSVAAPPSATGDIGAGMHGVDMMLQLARRHAVTGPPNRTATADFRVDPTMPALPNASSIHESPKARLLGQHSAGAGSDRNLTNFDSRPSQPLIELGIAPTAVARDSKKAAPLSPMSSALQEDEYFTASSYRNCLEGEKGETEKSFDAFQVVQARLQRKLKELTLGCDGDNRGGSENGRKGGQRYQRHSSDVDSALGFYEESPPPRQPPLANETPNASTSSPDVRNASQETARPTEGDKCTGKDVIEVELSQALSAEPVNYERIPVEEKNDANKRRPDLDFRFIRSPRHGTDTNVDAAAALPHQQQETFCSALGGTAVPPRQQWQQNDKMNGSSALIKENVIQHQHQQRDTSLTALHASRSRSRSWRSRGSAMPSSRRSVSAPRNPSIGSRGAASRPPAPKPISLHVDATVLEVVNGAELFALLRMRGVIQSQGDTEEYRLPARRCHRLYVTSEEHRQLQQLRQILTQSATAKANLQQIVPSYQKATMSTRHRNSEFDEGPPITAHMKR